MISPRKASALVVGLAIVLAMSACGDKDNDAGATTNVDLEAFDYYFKPTAFTTDIGGSLQVHFTNNGENTHSFTSPDLGDADTEVQAGQDATITITLPDEPGTYDFFCKFHPNDMKGTVSVGGAAQPGGQVTYSPTPDDTSTDSGYSGY